MTAESEAEATRRTSARGYSPFAKALHWLTFALMVGQFALGYVMDVGGRGRGRGRGRSGGSGRGRGRGGEEELTLFGDDGLLTAHVILGLTILLLTLLRLYWRRHKGLPPWADGLSAGERRLAHWTERALYLLLLVIPMTGLYLVFVSEEAVALHVGSHIAFYVAFAAHLGLVLKHQVVDRDGLLRRML